MLVHINEDDQGVIEEMMVVLKGGSSHGQV